MSDDADGPKGPANHGPWHLGSVEELMELLHELMRIRVNGELRLRGHSDARICLFEGAIAWVHMQEHHENLGDVLRRELGLSQNDLRRGMEHCQATGRRFGEGMVELGLLEASELRECLRVHIGDQLVEVLTWPGPLTVTHIGDAHRYDHAFTFSADDLTRRPLLPTPAEQRWLDAITADCVVRLRKLALVCVVETEEGTVLGSATGTDPPAEDLLGLCLAGLHRMAGKRITQSDGMPNGLVLRGSHGCVFAQPFPGRPQWLLLLGGPVQPGRLLSVAHSAITAAGEPEA